MATARERVQSLDARLRELEERFIGSGIQQQILQSAPLDGTSTTHQVNAAPTPQTNSPQRPYYPIRATGFGSAARLNDVAIPSTALMGGQGGQGLASTVAGASTQPHHHPAASGASPRALPLERQLLQIAPREDTESNVRPPLAPAPRPSASAEVPLRLYRQGHPYRDLGPPRSVWEADKTAAVLALADRVQQLETELKQERKQQGPADPSADNNEEENRTNVAQCVMPPPTLDLLPVPHGVLGISRHTNHAPYDGLLQPAVKPPLPVKYYAPPPPGQQPMSLEAALVRVPAAQGSRGHTRAFAASVTASTVPSVMMRTRRNLENAQPPEASHAVEGDENQCRTVIPTAAARANGGQGAVGAAASGCGGGGRGGGDGGVTSVGVSAPRSYASVAASAAASLQMAASRDAVRLHAGERYPMVAAALAAGAPGSGGSTWEQAQMRALMSLEQQREALRVQLDEYQDQEARHRRQLAELRERHRKDMLGAAGIAGRKLQRLMGSAWAAYARRLLVLRVSRALHVWRRIATRNRRLVWARAVWRQRELAAVFSEWHVVVLGNRHERQCRRRAFLRRQRSVLLAWAAGAAECRRMRRLEGRAQRARCRRLLFAWRRRAGELRRKRLRLVGAEAHRRVVLLRSGWRGLAGEVVRGRQAEAALRSRLAKVTLLRAFQTWVARTRLIRRLDCKRRRAVLRSSLRAWSAHASRQAAVSRKLRGMRATWRRRQLVVLFEAWAAAARRLAQLEAAYRALRDALRRQLLAEGLSSLRLAPRERAWARRCIAMALRAWCHIACRAARNRRIVLARRVSRARSTVTAAFDAWRVLGKARSVRLHVREIHRLQELEPTYEHQMELVRQDRAAVQSHNLAVMSELNQLRAELLRGFVMSAEGGLLGKPLRWHLLTPGSGQWLPPPRSRHSALYLRGLQLMPVAPAMRSPGTVMQPLNTPSTLAGAPSPNGAYVFSPGAQQWLKQGAQLLGPGSPGAGSGIGPAQGGEGQVMVPGVGGVLVVFGGVNEEDWFRDLHVLELSYSDVGGTGFQWHQVEVEAEVGMGAETGRTQHGADAWPHTATTTRGSSRATSKLPLPTRRDHAACVISPNEFAVVGGFDGSLELMDIHVVTVRAAEDGTGWSARVRAVAPRNRVPPGRSHHSVTAHEAGRSLYVFGGYASARGTLGELWAFHLAHMEWWQPNTTGDQPPPRRNHVAALVGGRLYVHGGFNGTECLGDTWVLDPQTWHWQLLNARGLALSPRRGHAAEVVDDRYLVLHGGYDGSGHLGDGAVLDTVTGTWRDLAAAGGPEDMPTARAHHSLTLVGHVMVALGGSGPSGPLLDMHLLESPPLMAGLAQQYRLMATAAQLSATQAAMADVEAALAVTRHRAEQVEQQLQALRDGSSELLSRHNAALADIDRLKARLAVEATRVVAGEAVTAEAQLALATAERRLRRTREGGQEMAEAARDMHDTVCDLREEVARLRGQLLTAVQQQTRESSHLAATSAERQLLQQQLAGAQQETALLRGMLAAAETEFRAALDRQRSAAEAELAAATEHTKQLAVAAAAAAGGAAAAGTAADMDLVALQQLATATARAETAEIRVHAMEREYGVLQADLANVKRHLQQQRQAREAAEERAAAAMQHMHSSELRYQEQLEDLQRQLAQAQRERWRNDLGLGQGRTQPRKRAAPQVEETAGAGREQPQVEESVKVKRQERDEGQTANWEEAEQLLLNARPPPEVVLKKEPIQRLIEASHGSELLDPMDPRASFTVHHAEALLVEDPGLEVLPEVARLLELQRRIQAPN